ncbi:YggS family pyridoxal phosphate-dependent enzyme [Thioflexithrix psekupsensis]|uniref:Pyridoxal phosphate homeostasis protein n=1 Tax=Thioflexithrix psekupsensis TaxID=1570016 RepID=A0A251X7N8_9GAMM|nr:YggS family pyridoxal phosphate-dependent enzyme [Thioflexithrix psekupsensis]OUD14068.1 YggS family pyridoxal phosphate enzyme [Thioflexithrix psekupsensis]
MVNVTLLQRYQQALERVQTQIKAAAFQAQRDPKEITLIAVSKQQPIAAIEACYALGIRDFGENRSDELAQKAQQLAHLTDLKWHFIGHLQSRQSEAVARYAHYFHALDRLKIAQRLSQQLQVFNRHLPVFLQVNISGELSKSGWPCALWPEHEQERTALLNDLLTIQQLPYLQVQGLMTLLPYEAANESLLLWFKRLAQLAETLPLHSQPAARSYLSMGMSHDFQWAIAAGATHIRVGTALFGEI